MADVLVQTLIPPRLAKWLKQSAEREGLSVAAWVRRLIMMQEAQTAHMQAWHRPPTEQVRTLSEVWGRPGAPNIMLDRVAAHADGSIEVRVHSAKSGAPLTGRDLLQANVLAENIEKGGWFALAGSMNAWRVVNSFADDAHGGQLILTLRPEGRHDVRLFDVTPSWWADAKTSKRRRAVAFQTFLSEVKVGVGVTTGADCSGLDAPRMTFTLPDGHGGLTDEAAKALQKRITAKLEAT